MRKFYTFCFALFVGIRASADYPIETLSRPLTTPRGAFETSLAFNNTRFAELRITFGVMKELQVGIDWAGLSARSLMPSPQLGVHAAYSLFESEFVRGKACVVVPIFIQNSVLQEVGFSVPTFFSLVPEHLNVVLLEDLVSVAWSNEWNAQFHFPVRMLWQATRALAFNLSTDLATLNTNSARSAYADTHILETTPLRFQAVYAITPEVDVYTGLGIENAKNATGISAALGVVVRTGVKG